MALIAPADIVFLSLPTSARSRTGQIQLLCQVRGLGKIGKSGRARAQERASGRADASFRGKVVGLLTSIWAARAPVP